jgi:hypothetical protein
VGFSPDGKHVAAGTGNGVILLINAESGGIEKTFSAAPVSDAVKAPATIAGIATKTGGEELKAEALPEGASVTGLEAQPGRIELASRNEHVQLLITARLASGDTVDATRMAQYEVSDGLGSVSPPGRFTSLKPGAGKVRATLGGHSVELPVVLSEGVREFDADFVRDVNPIVSRLGCTAGTCHGAREGKNGFKLSLRGYDPIYDVRAVTDDHAARRVNFASPDESLMLLKATGAVPHEGGARTAPDSAYYAILRRWIASGARLDLTTPRVTQIEVFPKNPTVQNIGAKQQMRVVATYADGRTRDVTAEAFVESGNMDVLSAGDGALVTTLRRGEAPILARYEGSYAATTLTVMGDRSGFVWKEPPVNNRIDELVAAKWQRLKILPSDLCGDAEFVRRASLDLTGLPPTAEAVREFLANPRDPRSKRDALIEKLLNSPDYIDHWANKWADLLQVNRKFLGQEGAELFRKWIRNQIAANAPYDQFVREILTATGSNKDNPAASYWKILREPTEAMENTTHLFLATRFNCNKCHDHPFERWTQDQYYELTQYFAQVELKKDDASGDRRIGGTAVEGSKPLFEMVSDKRDGAVKHDRTGKNVAPKFPFATKSADPGDNAPRRAELAAWLTSPENRYFAASYVNRLWGYLLGVGLVEPLDDIRAGNPPSNPELLDHLTREFVESGFNTRHILRQICQSRTYQLSLSTHEWNSDDRSNYSHALPRRLPAEVLLDAVYAVTGSAPNFPGAKPGTRAAQLVDSAVDLPSGFLANLGRPARESACECERSNDIKLSSVMSLLSGPAVSEAVNDPGNALAGLVRRETDDRRLADELFLRVLNRPAASRELDAVVKAGRELEMEHARLLDELTKAEGTWSQLKPQLDQQRASVIATAEKALADHLVSRAPLNASAQRERNERMAAADAAMKEHEPALQLAVEQWEAGLTTNHLAVTWQPLDAKEIRGSGSARLTKLPDGSIRSSGSVGELPEYVITAETPLTHITGIKLEVLPDADLPNFGPGYKDGNFYLSEFVVEFASKTNAANFARATITDAAADRNADGLDLKQLFNKIGEQGRREGWSIGDATGQPHWAAFALEKPVGDTNGTLLRVTLQHRYEAPYEIGRFRLWVTTGPAPTAEGLPSDVAQIIKAPVRNRTDAQRARIISHVSALNPETLKRSFAIELAQKPLPEDPRLAELERELARAARPILADPRVVQLRKDLDLSRRQLEQRRLTAAQDLVWALINTPSFLFNR